MGKLKWVTKSVSFPSAFGLGLLFVLPVFAYPFRGHCLHEFALGGGSVAPARPEPQPEGRNAWATPDPRRKHRDTSEFDGTRF